jgi:hypothetical protein
VLFLHIGGQPAILTNTEKVQDSFSVLSNKESLTPFLSSGIRFVETPAIDADFSHLALARIANVLWDD